MSKIINPSAASDNQFMFPLFRLPFRPLFVGGLALSLVVMLLWGGFWTGIFIFEPWGGMFWWHAHEMIFGFCCAVLVGFLLTAAKNWTGLKGLSGLPLILLFSCWLMARFLLLIPNHQSLLLVIGSTALFWMLAIWFYTRMIVKSRLWRNIGFSFVLIGLACVDLVSVYAVNAGDNFITYFHAALVFFIIVISVIGGRIIPFFTSSATGSAKVEPLAILELLAVLLSLSLLVCCIFLGLSDANLSIGVICSLLGLVHILRVLRWPIKAAFKTPMLWTLYLAYGFLVVGVFMLAAYHFQWLTNLSAVMHLINIGAIGLMIISMVSRVSLGHTGRPIECDRMLFVAMLLVINAMLVRVIIPLIGATQYLIEAYVISTLLWCLAVAFWLIKFIPILVTQRFDGKPE